MLTLQEGYEAIRRSFAQHAPGEYVKSMRPDTENWPACAYRGENGLKCAIGRLIPDALYEPAMEKSGSVNGLIQDFPMVCEFVGITRENLPQWNLLQRAHDSSELGTAADIIRRLDEAATELELETPASIKQRLDELGDEAAKLSRRRAEFDAQV